MTRIAITRPIDPELAALWDEAKRNVEARAMAAQLDAMEATLRQTAREHRDALVAAESRPIGASPADSDCCVGDVTRCRCASGAKQLAMSDADVDREKWMAVWSDESEAM